LAERAMPMAHLRRGKGLGSGQKGETADGFAEHHGGELSMPYAELSLLGHRPLEAKGLEPLSQNAGDGLGGDLAFFEGGRAADDISPGGVVKGDHLDAFDGFEQIEAVALADFLRFLYGRDSVIFQKAQNTVYPRVIVLEVNFLHAAPPIPFSD
jgi:hypothetical protein